MRNLEKEQILGKAELLRAASGEKVKRRAGRNVVESANESVRGVGSGMHGGRNIFLGDEKAGKS